MAKNRAGQDTKLWLGTLWTCSCGLVVQTDDSELDRLQIERHLLRNPTDTFTRQSQYTILSRDGRLVVPDLPAQVPTIVRQKEQPVLVTPESPESSLFAAEQPVLPSPDPGVFARMVGAVKRTLGL